MNIENMIDNDISSLEAEISARKNEVNSTYQHYGSAENMSDNDISSLEAEIRARRNEVKSTFQHYGSAENMSDNDISIIEANVAEKRREDIPYKEYLTSLLSNPIISDNQQFEDAVIRSMQSNGLMKNFTAKLVEEISKTIFKFKNIDKSDNVSVENQKQKIENLINVYVRYLYELKNHEWSFSGYGNDIGLEMIDSDMLDRLWQVQKQFDITFNMPIPKDLGEYYGKAFERNAKMVPAITLMYDDLKNKNVNWHQVLIYKENELTPRERYLQRKEEAVKQFELQRQEELKNTLTQIKTQQIDSTIEKQDQIETPSIKI